MKSMVGYIRLEDKDSLGEKVKIGKTLRVSDKPRLGSLHTGFHAFGSISQVTHHVMRARTFLCKVRVSGDLDIKRDDSEAGFSEVAGQRMKCLAMIEPKKVGRSYLASLLIKKYRQLVRSKQMPSHVGLLRAFKSAKEGGPIPEDIRSTISALGDVHYIKWGESVYPPLVGINRFWDSLNIISSLHKGMKSNLRSLRRGIDSIAQSYPHKFITACMDLEDCEAIGLIVKNLMGWDRTKASSEIDKMFDKALDVSCSSGEIVTTV